MNDHNSIRKETTKKMHDEGKLQHYLWTKKLLLKNIQEVRSDLDCSKLSVQNLRDLCLQLRDVIYNVQYYKFIQINIMDLTQEDVDLLVARNKSINKRRLVKSKEQGRKYEILYKSLTKKYNLVPKYTEWNQFRLIEFEAKFIQELEKEYKLSGLYTMNIQEFVYNSIKNDISRRKYYKWHK